MTTTLHAHIDSRTVDCDGPFDRSYVMTMNTEESEDAEHYGAMDFQNRVMSSIVSLHGMGGTLTVDMFEDGTARLSWSEPTEEGYRGIAALFCTDDCDTDEYSQRDHYAEAMGY